MITINEVFVAARWQQLLHGPQLDGEVGHQRAQGKLRGQKKKGKRNSRGEQSKLQQMDLYGCTISHTSEAWGNEATNKKGNTCRIGRALNPTGFTV